MSEKSPRERWRAREPEGWSWAPRIDEWGAWLLGALVGGALYLLKALLNFDRWNWKRLRQAALWIPRRYTAILGTLAVALTPVWLWLIWDLFREVMGLIDALGTAVEAEDRRNIAYALGVTTAALAGLVAAPLVLIRAWVSERHTRTAEEGLITERFTRAVEQLGAEKTVRRRSREIRWCRAEDAADEPPREATEIEGEPLAIPEDAVICEKGEWRSFERTEPNLEVRLGAIYALERIAQDSERDHIPIMETLCAYIRENAPARTAQDHGLGERPDWPEDGDAEAIAAHRRAMEKRTWDLRTWARSLPPRRVDVQAALTVLGRRSGDRIEYEKAHDFHLDLRNTNLQRADLAGLNLGPARLAGARLEGADLRGARLEGADLRGARLEGAYLTLAGLEGADLREARLEGADLAGAQLEGAYLWRARLEGADLSWARLERADLWEARLERAYLWRARLEGADLREARLERADLSEARLEGADLREARLARAILRGADLTSARNLTQEQINTAFGDGTTKLPAGLVMPDHWDNEPFDGVPWEDEKYQAWLAAGAPPGRPRGAPPAEAPDGGGAPGCGRRAAGKGRRHRA